jgi:hypothetical protein
MVMMNRRAYFIPLLTPVLLLAIATESHAGDPDASCSPWFVSTVEFDRGTFPEGFAIERRQEADMPYHTDHYEGLPASIAYTGSTPVFIFAHKHRGFALKLVEGKTFYTAYTVTPENIGSKKIGWHDHPYGNYQITSWILHYLAGVEIRGGCGDNRPSDIRLPEVQPFSITIVVGNRRSAISGRVVHRLNENYDPTAQARDPRYQQLLRQYQNQSLEKIPIIGSVLARANDYRSFSAVTAFALIAGLACGAFWIFRNRRT